MAARRTTAGWGGGPRAIIGALAWVAAAAWLAGAGHAQTPRTVRDGVFTEAQAARGQALYQAQCASCHGDKLEGAQGPPLVADGFLGRWSTEPLLALVNKIRNTMPANAAGSLTVAQATDITTHLLKGGGFPTGRAELASDDASLGRVAWPAGLVARPTAAAGPGRSYPPVGNLAQLMRGVFFTNANLIFTVQTHDPAAPPPPATTTNQDRGFSFVEWGAGIYGGWELVDNAAIALADASPLMLTPGLRCENGRPAPVNEPDWIRFTEQTIAAAKLAYKASQARSQDAVSEATGDLSDACAACHQAYREVRGVSRTPDPTDPSNKASRCLPRLAK